MSVISQETRLHHHVLESPLPVIQDLDEQQLSASNHPTDKLSMTFKGTLKNGAAEEVVSCCEEAGADLKDVFEGSVDNDPPTIKSQLWK